jgi:hypothetical protein
VRPRVQIPVLPKKGQREARKEGREEEGKGRRKKGGKGGKREGRMEGRKKIWGALVSQAPTFLRALFSPKLTTEQGTFRILAGWTV